MDREAIARRRKAIISKLSEDAPYTFTDQKHLDANTPERAYWHLGYAAALKDIERMFERNPQ